MSGWVAGAVVVGSLASAAISADAASSAADAQSRSAANAASLQKSQYDQTRADQMPFLQGGYTGENQLLTLLGLQGGNTKDPAYGSMSKSFGASDFQADPGYQFRLAEGLKGLDRTAAARGGLISGQALKAASAFSGQQASDEYQNAYNRYNANRAAILNPLQSLAGAGQSQSNTLAQSSQNYANNAGNAMMAGGNAQASGYVGQANAWNNAIGSMTNYGMQTNMLNKMYPTSTGTLPGAGSRTGAGVY
jgi:hypothetical protein